MKLLIVDYFALLHRSRNALLRTTGGLSNSAGRPTTGTFGFTNNLLSVIAKEQPTHIVVCYDAGGNWRKKENTDYKANRTAPVDQDDFRQESYDILDEVLPALGITATGIKGYEADDLIYTLSKNATDFEEVVILTCDQDILQCVTDKISVLLFSSARNIRKMGVEEVVEKWGVKPQHIALVKALAGDSSDNIKGIRGVGQKTATKIVIESYAVLDNIFKHPKVVNYKEKVLENLRLIRSSYVAELQDVNFSDYQLGGSTIEHVQETFQRYEFKTLLKNLSKIQKNLRMAN